MHLSLLSDAIFSDLVDDSGASPGCGGRIEAGQHHAQGVLRGLIFAAVLLAPFASAFAPAALSQPAWMQASPDQRP